MRGAQVIALRPGVAQEVGGGDGADDVRAVVVVHGAAEAVSEVARHLARLRAAGLQPHTVYAGLGILTFHYRLSFNTRGSEPLTKKSRIDRHDQCINIGCCETYQALLFCSVHLHNEGTRG